MDEWNNVLGDLWDTATGVFDKFIDLESTKLQNELYLEQYRATREIDRAQAPVGSDTYFANAASDINWSYVILALLGLGAAYMIVKD